MEATYNYSRRNHSSSINDSIMIEEHYVFTTVGFTFRLILCVLLVLTAIVGCAGNVLVFRFARETQRKRKNQIARFAPRQFCFFIQSLAISDVLAVCIAVPLLCTELFVPIVNDNWPCKVVRYVYMVFPTITSFNLVVIGLERYLGVCYPTKCLSHVKAQRLVKGAWILGAIIPLFAVSTYKPVYHKLSETQYKLICEHYSSDIVARILRASHGLLVYVLPIIFLFFTSVSILRLIWTRKTDGTQGNTTRNDQKKKKRATTLLVAIILAFILCYAPPMLYPMYRILIKPSVDLQTETVFRGIRVILMYINSPLNFCIHLVQLPGFYSSLKSIIPWRINMHLTHKWNVPGESTQNKELRRKCESLPNLLSIQNISHENRSRRSSV